MSRPESRRGAPAFADHRRRDNRVIVSARQSRCTARMLPRCLPAKRDFRDQRPVPHLSLLCRPAFARREARSYSKARGGLSCRMEMLETSNPGTVWVHRVRVGAARLDRPSRASGPASTARWKAFPPGSVPHRRQRDRTRLRADAPKATAIGSNVKARRPRISSLISASVTTSMLEDSHQTRCVRHPTSTRPVAALRPAGRPGLQLRRRRVPIASLPSPTSPRP